MRTRYKMVLAVLAGAGLGAGAIQALHAQAKAPAYVITEVDIIDQGPSRSFPRRSRRQSRGRAGNT
jgi:hypothetical protein